MKSLVTEVVGMQYRVTAHTRKMLAQHCTQGPIEVEIVREPMNVHDENALKVILLSTPYKGMHVGYVSRHTAVSLSPALDEKRATVVEAHITDIRAEDGDGDLVIGFTKRSTKRKTSKVKRT